MTTIENTSSTSVPVDAAGALIRLQAVEKVYRTGRLSFPALRGIDLEIDALVAGGALFVLGLVASEVLRLWKPSQ